MVHSKKALRGLLIALGFFLALYFRIIFIHIITADMTIYLLPWYDNIVKSGLSGALTVEIYNYTPSYLYLLSIMAQFHFIPPIVAIKSISYLFDGAAAIAVFQIIKLRIPHGNAAWCGFFCVLFLPTVMIESAVWGQCDVIYTAFLLWSLFFLLKNKNLASIVCFSFAISFKLQAIFFAPIFLILFLRKRIPFALFLTIPAIYFLTMIPAWLSGCPMSKLVMTYFRQYDTYNDLSMNAPNPYAFISNNYMMQKSYIGIGIAFLLVLIYILFRWKKWDEVTPTTLCYDASILTMLIPFLLPKMHERYFYPACLFLLVLVFFHKDFLPIGIMVQISSIISYLPYLTGSPDILVKIAAGINGLVILGLFMSFSQYRQELAPKSRKELEIPKAV